MAGKDKIFQLRYSDEDAEMLKKVADSKGLPASGYLRMHIREAYDQLMKTKK